MENGNWSKQSLDQFVWLVLEQNDLQPTEEAKPLRWLRRITFDLTGLPPTVREIEAFQRSLDQTENWELVYSATVDRLLESPAFGEHMAVAWLDAARYADSYGYQSDGLNTQWPYRDWVVSAFNNNLPYDEFITWQLAGDLVDSPTREQRLATAFNRIHRLNNEGGAVFEEWRIENVADRVQTFGTAVLGLTLECCRCHDHKYDPIPMKDFYAMSAFFNSIDENGVYDVSQKVPVPSLLLPTEEQATELKAALGDLQRIEQQYELAVAQARKRFLDWKLETGSLKDSPDLVRAVSFDAPYKKEELEEIYYTGVDDAKETANLKTVHVQSIPFPQMPGDIADDVKKRPHLDQSSLSRQVIEFDGERGIVLPGIETFDRWTPFSIVLTLRELDRVKQPAVIAQSSYGQLTFNGWDLVAEDGFLKLRMYRVWPGNMIAVRSKNQIPLDQWCQIAATYDGSSRAKGLKIFLDGDQLETEIIKDQIKKRASVPGHHGGKLTIGQRFRDRGLKGWLLDDVRVYSRSLSPSELAHFADKTVAPSQDFYVGAIDAELRESFAKLTAARKRVVLAEESMREIPVMDEMTEPRETHVLARGEYNAPTNDETRVQRAILSNIGPKFPVNAPLNRLGLARWVTMPDHPLTSRVIVNRIWSNFFGDGLVRTPENFGLQGQLPTHPNLLDWLARDFIEHNWDIKRLCTTIALSATYRQDSRTSAKLADFDPENRFLARGPSHRLSSEQIRDLALLSSGLLNPVRGGPPVSPYQAGGDLWRESNSMSPSYSQSVGKDLYRRSLYSVWKRTAPLPNMLAFDAQSREVCIVKRSRTNTPLQALVLMNDQQFVEAARSLAEIVLQSKTERSAQIDTAFLRLTGRTPTEEEKKILSELADLEAAFYAARPKEAKKLIESGDSVPSDSLDPVQLASMTIVCQAIMNLDATIWNR